DAASADAARRLRDLLADPDGWAQPPRGLLGQILAGTDSAAGRDDRRQAQMRRTVRAGAVALLAAASVVIGIVVTRGPATTDVVLAGTRLAPAASATAKLHATPSGLAIELDLSGLPPSAPGYYYQAWMKGPRGLVTIGTFHLRGGPGTVELWSAVSLTDYPAITVTREPEDGNPASSGQVVLTNRHP
ncbi:MAG: anti-sigma factor, partial [Streptosporangiaceae bacterium]